jgi:nitrous oxide reductase accessory protein NosL
MVSDYYTQDAIDGKKAFYVIGSDVYGPMGNEFIPFISLEDAKTFKEDHLGVEILSFDEITEEKVYKLDE